MWKKCSITVKFISLISLLIVLLITSLSTVMISVANKSQSDQAQAFTRSLKDVQEREGQLLKQKLFQKGDTLMDLLSQPAAALIASYDFDTLKQLAGSVAADQDVVFATFYDPDGNPITEESSNLSGSEIKEHEILYEGEVVGKLKMGLNMASVHKTIAELDGRISTILEQTSKARENARQTSIYSTIVSGLIGVVLLCVTVYFTLRRLVIKPVNQIIIRLTDGAGRVSSASNQISTSSTSLAEGSSEQAASIEETSSSLEEMSSMTRQNADNVNQADRLMKEANQIVKQATTSMSELTQSIQNISRASEETSKIIKTIDEIAFQTNLLALNAAVEAARAGEAGAGFAVVADEVRNLAMRAADAARNTAELIESTVTRAGEGTNLVSSTGEKFSEVATSVVKVGELIEEITAASNEQAQGIGQVNTAVNEMDKVVQQNAANAEESAAASEEMNHQAAQLKELVGELVALVKGCEDSDRVNPDAKPDQVVSRKSDIADRRDDPSEIKALAEPDQIASDRF